MDITSELSEDGRESQQGSATPLSRSGAIRSVKRTSSPHSNAKKTGVSSSPFGAIIEDVEMSDGTIERHSAMSRKGEEYARKIGNTNMNNESVFDILMNSELNGDASATGILDEIYSNANSATSRPPQSSADSNSSQARIAEARSNKRSHNVAFRESSSMDESVRAEDSISQSAVPAVAQVHNRNAIPDPSQMDNVDFVGDLLRMSMDDAARLPPPERPPNNQRGFGGGNAKRGQDRPSRYTAKQTANGFQNNGSGDDRQGGRRNGPQGSEREEREPPNFDAIGSYGRKIDLLFHDGEQLSDESAMVIVNRIESIHNHWQVKLLRPAEDNLEPVISPNEVKQDIKTTCYNAYRLLLELTRNINYDELVQAGVIATHPSRLPNEPAPNAESILRAATAEEDEENAAFLANNASPLQLSVFQSAAMLQKRRLTEMKDEIVNRSIIPQETKQNVLRMWGELVLYIGACMDVVATYYKIKFVDATVVAREALEMNDMQHETYKKDDKFHFLSKICAKLSQLSWRRGPHRDWLYREHWISINQRSNFWMKVMTVEQFLSEICDPSNGPEVLPFLKYFISNYGLADLIKELPEGMLPKVMPKRNFLAFKNGILDNKANVFMEVGSKVYKKAVLEGPVTCYCYSYSDGNYPNHGYDRNTGIFDHSDVFAKLYADPDEGFMDLRPGSLPSKHWSKDSVPIISDNIKAQRFDLHTQQTLWFSLARLQRPLDGLQYALFVVGRPNSGKSTLLLFPTLFVPSEYRAIIPANAEAVFGLQLLISKECKFVKHLGAILDMNGRISIPPAQLNSIITGEEVTVQVKQQDTRTAVCDMPFVASGNSIVRDPNPTNMAAQLRRYVYINFDILPNVGGEAISVASVLRAMPAYIRMTTIVYHEFWYNKNRADARYKNSNNIWTFVSPYIRDLQLDAMSEVSKASRFLADNTWLVATHDENDILSIETLRFISKLHMMHKEGENFELLRTPGATKEYPVPKAGEVVDAIWMIHKRAAIEKYGDRMCKDRFGGELPERGIECQLGDFATEKYVVGLRLTDRYMDIIKTYLPTMTRAIDAEDQEANLPAAQGAAKKRSIGVVPRQDAKNVARTRAVKAGSAKVPVAKVAAASPNIMQMTDDMFPSNDEIELMELTLHGNTSMDITPLRRMAADRVSDIEFEEDD